MNNISKEKANIDIAIRDSFKKPMQPFCCHYTSLHALFKFILNFKSIIIYVKYTEGPT